MTEINAGDLYKLATDIAGDDVRLLRLGHELGFTEPQIHNYMATNKMGVTLGTSGTSSMFFAWKQNTRRAEQIPKLSKALTTAGFDGLAEKYFDASQSTSAQPSASEGTSSQEKVTFEHINKLSRKFPARNYSLLCEKLGFDFNEATNILDEHRNSHQGALEEILKSWVNTTGGSKAALRAALKNAEAGGLCHLLE